MASLAVKRIRRDLRDIIKSEKTVPCGIKVELINDSFFELRGEITGPINTPYEGGKFELEIKIPDSYPIHPPEIWFLTKIWHANISSDTGIICLDILKHQWSACLTLRTVLLSIQVLLSHPRPDDPQDIIVARQFLENPEMFDLTARHWTNVYAGGTSKNQNFDDKIRKLVELGICEIDSRAFLSASNWDLEYAIKELERYRSGSDEDTSYRSEYDPSKDDPSEDDFSEDDLSEGDLSENDLSEDDLSEDDLSEDNLSDDNQSVNDQD